jgi:hypothetical protein
VELACASGVATGLSQLLLCVSGYWLKPVATNGKGLRAMRSVLAGRGGDPGSVGFHRWPLLLLAAPAGVATWSGWVGLGDLSGWGLIAPLPGIVDDFEINTAITLPIGVEAYAAYALGAWLSSRPLSPMTRKFAMWSALGSLLLGMLGQVAYHLLINAGYDRAPWQITTLVSCLPVLVLGMGAGLFHLVSRDQGTTTADDNTETQGETDGQDSDRDDQWGRFALEAVQSGDLPDRVDAADQAPSGERGLGEGVLRLDRQRGEWPGDLPAEHRRIDDLQDQADEHVALHRVSKADALRHAFAALGRRDIPAALAWLTERDVTVDRSYAYTVQWQPPRPLAAVSGGEHR